MSSRAKGKRGELEARDQVRVHWHCPQCTRAAQVSGKFSADLLGGPPGLHLEVKRHKRIAALGFMEQAERDAGKDECPVVLMREDHRAEWFVLFCIEDTERFVAAYLAARGRKHDSVGSAS